MVELHMYTLSTVNYLYSIAIKVTTVVAVVGFTDAINETGDPDPLLMK